MAYLSYQTNTNLSTLVKRVIGYRILLCFFLALAVLFSVTIVEVIGSLHQLEKNIEEQCITLESYIISQVLVKNNEAIKPKLDALNQQSGTIKFSLVNKNQASTLKKQLQWHFPFSWRYLYPAKNIDGSQLGIIIVNGSLFDDRTLFSGIVTKISLLLLFCLIIFIVLYPLGTRIPQQLFISPINNLLLLLRNGEAKSETDNTSIYIEEINEIKDKITELLIEAEKRSHDAALGQIAMQVAHDIRSPLIVLNLETEDLSSVPEKKRIEIRNAIQRVNDIANNLLSQYKQDKNTATNEISFHPEPLIILLESILSEKRVELSHSSIQIELEKCAEADTFFVKVDIAGFKRALSNIINNSIEAIKENGIITVKVSNNSRQIVISIMDNGCGIPKQLLPLVFEPGVSFGKAQGSGLGLPYIINKIYSWNGNYTITSEVNEGTIFEIILPRAMSANWFASSVSMPQNWTIVVFDDDENIHKIWDERLSNECLTLNNLKVLHFHTPEELENYCKFQETSHTTFLLDYELAGHKENGLTLAEKLNITKKAFLVTSRYEDTPIRENCQNLGMKMIPKSFVLTIPIKIIENVDLIFIDDDESITEIWKNRAKVSEKNIDVFNDIHEFMYIFNLYKKDTPIYIDSALGGNLKGEDFAKILFDNDYRNLILSTSYEKEKFQNIYWIKDVVDKYPPF